MKLATKMLFDIFSCIEREIKLSPPRDDERFNGIKCGKILECEEIRQYKPLEVFYIISVFAANGLIEIDTKRNLPQTDTSIISITYKGHGYLRALRGRVYPPEAAEKPEKRRKRKPPMFY